MKRIITLLNVVATMFVLGLVRQEPAQAEEACSVATLQGTYILTGRSDFGSRVSGDPTTYPRVMVGVQTYNGEGTVVGYITQSQGGDIVRRGGGKNTYTLNDDCTGTITGDSGNWEIVVSRDGSVGEEILVDQGNIVRLSFKRQ